MNDTSFRPYWERAGYRFEFAPEHLLRMICHKHPSRTIHCSHRLKEFENVYYLNNRQTVVLAKVIFDAMRCLFFFRVLSSKKLSTCVTHDGAIFSTKITHLTFSIGRRFRLWLLVQFGSVVYWRLLSWFQANSARLAQSVEHETLNLRVVGSSPTLGAFI